MTRIPTVLPEVRPWLLFFLIAFGLGYPALNRYDVRAAVPDAAIYATLASEGPSAVEGRFDFACLCLTYRESFTGWPRGMSEPGTRFHSDFWL